ncbi:MAG: hypothetical protein KQJ78_15015 [Deltaproteobacteria bacterium]|nr:hypothetical protein [Deltaproteobacteria bacterium]
MPVLEEYPQVPEREGWFDRPGNMRKFLIFFFCVLGVLLVAGFFVTPHGHFTWEETPDFFAAYGFIAYVTLVTVAKLWRRVIKRREDYYER